MASSVELLRPLGSLKILAPKSKSVYRLLGALIQAATDRKAPTDITCELLIENGNSHLKIEFIPPLLRDEFIDLLRFADPALFARGRILYIEDASGGLEVHVEDWTSGDPRSLHLPLYPTDVPQELCDLGGALLIFGIDRGDELEWSSLDEAQLLSRTVLGNRKSPRIDLRLMHVGAPREIHPAWEWESFRAEQLGPEQLRAQAPFRDEIPLRLGDKTAKGACGVSFGSAKQRVRVYDTKQTYPDVEKILARRITTTFKQMLPPRLQRKLIVYFEVDLSNTVEPGPLGELPFHFIEDLARGVSKFLSALEGSRDYQQLLSKANEWAINYESKKLTQRKHRARYMRTVCLVKAGTDIPIYKEPENEQDVVLLTCMLAQHGIFESFQFLDYQTKEGIDSLVRLQLTKTRECNEDAIVEFKYMLEGFLNELHPLSLINLIVAWDVTESRFADSEYLLSPPIEGKKWLRRLQHRHEDALADVVLLKHLSVIKVKSQ